MFGPVALHPRGAAVLALRLSARERGDLMNQSEIGLGERRVRSLGVGMRELGVEERGSMAHEVGAIEQRVRRSCDVRATKQALAQDGFSARDGMRKRKSHKLDEGVAETVSTPTSPTFGDRTARSTIFSRHSEKAGRPPERSSRRRCRRRLSGTLDCDSPSRRRTPRAGCIECASRPVQSPPRCRAWNRCSGCRRSST